MNKLVTHTHTHTHTHTRTQVYQYNDFFYLLSDEIDRGIDRGSPRHGTKEEHDSVQLKLLCGGDVLESFAVPGLWKDEDVRYVPPSWEGIIVQDKMLSFYQKRTHIFSSPEPDEFCDLMLSDFLIIHLSSVCTSTPMNDFSSETCANFFQTSCGAFFWRGGLKIYTNSHCPLIKMGHPAHIW